MLAGGEQRHFVEYSPDEADCKAFEVSCAIWVYCVPPEEDPDAEEDEDILVSISGNAEDIPEDAIPITGTLLCPGSEVPEQRMDGSSMGPFVIRDDREGDNECLLAAVSLDDMKAPDGYEYQGKEVSPMAERIEELGGCELERLLNCPSVIGSFKPLPVPPLQGKLRTACCRRPYLEARLEVDGFSEVELDEHGCFSIQRRRGPGTLPAQVMNVPEHLLPNGSSQQAVSYGSSRDDPVEIQVQCPVWIYLFPPEEEEEYELGPDDDPPEPLEGMVQLAVDAEMIPDEAKPIAGVLRCPGALQSEIVLDGSTMGPFAITSVPGEEALEWCLLSALTFTPDPLPEGFTECRARDPTPLFERCEELGGCELQRLGVPVTIGYVKAAAK